ncbi:transcriptional regulator family: Fungal Specific TF [Penicillium mononematosum]|uniref:transcriptional regulator family: Fungal Specific TF n=1 Tax=Penicillium mononematosum TaxID=268346 RepID=UPI00254862DD|nr:transcriptional regulator family: Fungal Specific TF [Penicillium mononematosum]KAJ6183698.1 transcriptional regulator family: Fungal Specific TF [Penicillium mononematosum]
MNDQSHCSPYSTGIEDESLHVIPAPTGKKRIPVKCDGERPCTRCQKLEKQCVFFEIPKDPVSERIEGVEYEVQYLRKQLDEMRELLKQSRSQPSPKTQPTHSPNQHCDRQQQVRHESACASSGSHYPHPQHHSQDEFSSVPIPSSAGYENGHQHQRSMPGSIPALSPNETSARPIYASSQIITRPLKRKRSGFEIRDEPITDFIDKGLITLECAVSYFNTFFGGCDRYIPIFDPQYDTFDSIRSRSSILLNAICAIGCMVETRSGGSISDLLHAELKRWMNVIIQNKELNCLESVQAMLVVACYSAERSLILSFATRMALDLELHEAFDELIQRLALQNEDMAYALPNQMFEEERALMWNARTWFGLLVLEHIFRVDGGKPPGIRLKGNVRRCRVLLSHPSSTILDLRLFSQVELNILRANVGDALGGKTSLDGQSIADYVHDMKIELDLWFDDWLRIIESCVAAAEEKPSLLVALRVQKCWAEMMLNCKALRSMGVENVAAMSTTERTILLTAKASARRHLRLIIADPDFYLAKLRYAMDFVWAKCAFSFLLLLKLSRLIPERDEEHQELLEQGNRLVDELSKAGASGTQSGAGNIYLQILKVSIEKYGRALMETQQPSSDGPTVTSPFWELFDAQADLQWFVPEQFVSEWDFPGLNLFYFPTAWQDFFGDFSLAM